MSFLVSERASLEAIKDIALYHYEKTKDKWYLELAKNVNFKLLHGRANKWQTGKF